MCVFKVAHHLPALLLFFRVLQLSVHYPAGHNSQNKNSNICEMFSSFQIRTLSLLLRVRGLPDASQFVRLHGSVAGELQQPLDVVEDGRLVVGQRKLHLPGRAQPRHLNTHEQLFKCVFKLPSHFPIQTANFSNLQDRTEFYLRLSFTSEFF